MISASMLLLFMAPQPTGQVADPTFGRLVTLSSTLLWEAVPTQEQVNSVVPPHAKEQGFVTMTCPVKEDGHLYQNCIFDSVVPADAGFEKAALSLTQWYKLPQEVIPRNSSVAPLASFSIRFAQDRNGMLLKSDRCIPPFCVNEPAF